MTTIDECPPLEEWQRRQAAAPEGLRKLLRVAREKAIALDDARRAKEEAARAELAARRAAFDERLADLLQSEGGEWMAAFREPDAKWEGANPFTLGHQFWVARFDLSPVGLHKIQVELIRDPDSGDVWRSEGAPFFVLHPTQGRSFRTLAEACSFAATYVRPLPPV